MKPATITITRGTQFPGERERVYRLRAGERGAGRILFEHRARGGSQADDAAYFACSDQADELGYKIVNTIAPWDIDGPTR